MLRHMERVLQMIAVLLDDERPATDDRQVRDFGFKQWEQDLRERKAAVRRARGWLRDSIRK